MTVFSRRQFIFSCASALCASSLARLHASESEVPDYRHPTARNIIYIFLSGGMSHIDTFDLKPNWKDQGPVTSCATDVDGLFVNALLPGCAKNMKHTALIRSLTSTQGAHETGRYMMRTNYPQRGTIVHPSIGSWSVYYKGTENNHIPGHVVIGAGSTHPGAGYMETKCAPLPIGDPRKGLQNSRRSKTISPERFDKRFELLQAVNAPFDAAYNVKEVRAYKDVYEEALALMRSQDLDAFDVNKEPSYMHQSYGDHTFGQSCLLARRLVEHDVRFVEIELGGWDTHLENFERLDELLPIFDQGYSALLSDLEQRGLLDETLVVVGTEFGRTPALTTDGNGRGHHPSAYSCLLAGGGIRGGTVYGATDERGAEVVDKPVRIQDFNATIAHAIGLPIDQRMYAPDGRPFTVGNTGAPLYELFR